MKNSDFYVVKWTIFVSIGPRGTLGDIGIKGELGDRGFPGEKGTQGHECLNTVNTL